MRTRMRLAMALLASMVLISSCGTAGFNGLYNVPLPGGADLGEHPYTVTATFDNVLNLVPQAAVKVDDVTVGQVSDVRLTPDAKSALVTMEINGEVELPANAIAQLRQASLLGAKFVALDTPADEPPTGALSEGAGIPLERTSRTVEIEEVFGALSLLLSGGGVEQLRTISEELNNALSGNEAEVRALLSRVDKLATELDAQKGDIVRAIDGLNQLSATLVEQKGNLTNALDNLEPGMRVVVEQREQLVGMLKSLNQLADVAVDTVDKSGDQLVANLKALQPTLDRLADAGHNLPTALKILPTYPLPSYAGHVVKGDYANVHATVDLRLDTLIENLSNSSQPFVPIPGVNDEPGQQPPSLPVDPGQPADPGTSVPQRSPLPLPLPGGQGGQQPSTAQPGPLGGLLGSLLGGG